MVALSEDNSLDELRNRAQDVLRRLRGLSSSDDLVQAKTLVEQLCHAREYDTMGILAEQVSRLDPKDAKNRRLYAQYLIESGKVTAAIDLLKPLQQRLPKDSPESAEAAGLLGRAYKQIFFDAGDKTGAMAREALKQAIAAYRKPFEEDPATHSWHGVNLLALLTRARRLGLRVANDLTPQTLAETLVSDLFAVPENKRDAWFLPTLAEASLGLNDWVAVERAVHAYAARKDAQAFHLASTLRQFTQVWDLEATDERGRGLVAILRARLAELPGGEVSVGAEELQRLRRQQTPEAGQLEAVLGREGPQTYAWWKTGLDRAQSVAAIYQRLGNRVGTGFLVRAKDFGRTPEDKLLVLTNFHVVNANGVYPGLKPEAAEIAFEASENKQRYLVKSLLWSSPPEQFDASLLRLEPQVEGIEPLPIAGSLPVLDEQPRVFIIGHPRGETLAFSFQDNELLDHEGPPAGRPQIPGVCRVHYRAPTEGGSSGSPVFDARLWEVIALHHKGGKFGMPRLNGQAGTYAANEGIGMGSIREGC